MRSEKSEYHSIDEYIAICPENVQPTLEKIREVIRLSAPLAEEKISYMMPAFFQNDRVLVYFAAQKNHLGFYPTASGIEHFREELSAYGTSKGTVRFPLDQPIPYDLISRIVKYRVQETEQKSWQSPARKKKK